MDKPSLFSTIKNNGIPDFWSNPAKMQEAYSLEEKLWKKKVHWKDSNIPGAGLGVFALEVISKGSTIRILKNGVNLLILNCPADVPPLTHSTKSYLTNYLAQVT